LVPVSADTHYFSVESSLKTTLC
ncbi:unnamed protein product, partial [Allacma fusca]